MGWSLLERLFSFSECLYEFCLFVFSLVLRGTYMTLFKKLEVNAKLIYVYKGTVYSQAHYHLSYLDNLKEREVYVVTPRSFWSIIIQSLPSYTSSFAPPPRTFEDSRHHPALHISHDRVRFRPELVKPRLVMEIAPGIIYPGSKATLLSFWTHSSFVASTTTVLSASLL